MSYDSDTSQISDLSGISRLSRPSGKHDSAWNISECQASSTIREPISRLTVGGPIGTASKVSRIIKLIDCCEDAICNHAKLKLLYDCAHEFARAENETIQNTLSKFRTILATNEASKYLQLSNLEKNNHSDLSLLGISDLPKFNLTDAEKREVNAGIDAMFKEKMDNFVESYKNSGGKILEISKNRESAGKTTLLESHETDSMRWNDPMNELCAEYYRDLRTCADLLCQWRRLKYAEMKELNTKNAENLLLQAEVAEVQVNISRKNCASRMFNETQTTAEAFGALSEGLDARILEMREKIQNQEILRTKYVDVSGPEYDQLLKRYSELCSVIKKKERLMEML